jgi:hypothetical protein
MEFDWSIRTIGEWRTFLSRARHANWMQTWPYAEALHKRDRKQSRLALILKGKKPIGMMSVQVVQAGPLQLVELKRGPLWFDIIPEASLVLEFAEAFRREYPRSPLRWVRWMPDHFLEPEGIERLKDLGFKISKQNFESSHLDLNQSEGDLRRNLRQKWRNCLNNAERSPLIVTVETSPQKLGLFLNHYLIHKSLKRFEGSTSEFLKEEIETAMKADDAFLVWGVSADQPVAGLAIVKHGRSATYRIGWNTMEGRQLKAHYRLIWETLLLLKKLGIESFDVGGLKRHEAPGVSYFKEGLGGQRYRCQFFKG